MSQWLLQYSRLNESLTEWLIDSLSQLLINRRKVGRTSIIFVSCWDHCRTILRSTWDRFGWKQLGIILGSPCDQLWIGLGSLWDLSRRMQRKATKRGGRRRRRGRRGKEDRGWRGGHEEKLEDGCTCVFVAEAQEYSPKPLTAFRKCLESVLELKSVQKVLKVLDA